MISRTYSDQPVAPLPNPGESGSVAPDMPSDGNKPVIPLPNPGEGGPVAPDTPSDGSKPVIPLPNPGEGGPVAPDMPSDGNKPVIPLPNPGEGGPVAPDIPSDGNKPVIPLPNPGEGGPVAPGVPGVGGQPVFPLPNPGGSVFPGGIVVPVWPRYGRVRFLNAAYGYRPFRILINQRRMVNWLGYAALSGYSRIPAGYQTITVIGPSGYIYIQKSLPFQINQPCTIAIINTASGLDLLQIPDSCCTPNGDYSNFRVSNLVLNSKPLDVLLADGRVVYGDVRYKETTAYKRIRPGAYQFFFAETNLTPMPAWMDIETLDSAFIGNYPVPNTVASLYLNAVSNANYTVFLMPSGPDSVQALLAETH